MFRQLADVVRPTEQRFLGQPVQTASRPASPAAVYLETKIGPVQSKLCRPGQLFESLQKQVFPRVTHHVPEPELEEWLHRLRRELSKKHARDTRCRQAEPTQRCNVFGLVNAGQHQMAEQEFAFQQRPQLSLRTHFKHGEPFAQSFHKRAGPAFAAIAQQVKRERERESACMISS